MKHFNPDNSIEKLNKYKNFDPNVKYPFFFHYIF
jgi:hypothetical protein